jgi:hypothetical protein
MTEHQPYTVTRRFDDFEVRSYDAHVLAQVDVRAELDAGAGAGFGPLFQYISGNNSSRQSIAMTAPVLQEPQGAGVQTVSFVMPADLPETGVPAPRDPRVRMTPVPPRTVAVHRFSGSARRDRFAEHGQRLIAAVWDAGLEPVGPLSYARFDPPWKPSFLRHNEAIVELADDVPRSRAGAGGGGS